MRLSLASLNPGQQDPFQGTGYQLTQGAGCLWSWSLAGRWAGQQRAEAVLSARMRFITDFLSFAVRGLRAFAVIRARTGRLCADVSPSVARAAARYMSASWTSSVARRALFHCVPASRLSDSRCDHLGPDP